MNENEKRMVQVKDLFEYGDEDTQEIAQIEILNLGIELGVPLEQQIEYLLWDLTRDQ